MTLAPLPPNDLRPELRPDTAEAEFLKWYWLKAELSAFCRKCGLSGGGSKAELTARVAATLAGRKPVSGATKSSKPKDAAPEALTLATVVTPGFRMSQKLRAFLEQHAGPGFRFNQALRDFFQDPAGRTLEDALALYETSRTQSAQLIAPQFEYNRHMREFYASHPGGSAQEARQAWWRKRQARKTD